MAAAAVPGAAVAEVEVEGGEVEGRWLPSVCLTVVAEVDRFVGVVGQ